MPRLNFGNVPDADDFSPLPEGKYLCQLKEIEESLTQNGDEMWNLRFEVVEGEYRSRVIFDRMVFSESTIALSRVKFICKRLGLDVSGEVNLVPDLLLRRTGYVSVETEEYTDRKGRTKKRNVVPFTGYEECEKIPSEKLDRETAEERERLLREAEEEGTEISDDDIPF